MEKSSYVLPDWSWWKPSNKPVNTSAPYGMARYAGDRDYVKAKYKRKPQEPTDHAHFRPCGGDEIIHAHGYGEIPHMHVHHRCYKCIERGL